MEALTTGSSLRRPFPEAEYFFRSNTSSSSSDVSKMKTRADHSAGEGDALRRDFLISGTVGSAPLENGPSAHSDSGTD